MTAFLISFLAVVALCLVVVVIKQILINKSSQSNIMTGSGNHAMKTAKYSHKFSICKNIGEADE